MTWLTFLIAGGLRGLVCVSRRERIPFRGTELPPGSHSSIRVGLGGPQGGSTSCVAPGEPPGRVSWVRADLHVVLARRTEAGRLPPALPRRPPSWGSRGSPQRRKQKETGCCCCRPAEKSLVFVAVWAKAACLALASRGHGRRVVTCLWEPYWGFHVGRRALVPFVEGRQAPLGSWLRKARHEPVEQSVSCLPSMPTRGTWSEVRSL